MTPPRDAGTLRAAFSAAALTLALTGAASASDLDMSGLVTVTPNWNGTVVTFYVARIDNHDYFGVSGTMRLEHWAFSTPYSGYPLFGYTLAEAQIGQLTAGYYIQNVYADAAFVPPPYGYYYPALVLTEFTYAGWVVRDWVNFSGRFMGTPPDSDGDGYPDLIDNCPFTPNPGQEDLDGDGVGDACDICPSDPSNDADGDLICGYSDNCPAAYNPTQIDTDGDQLGDACDACPSDASNDADGDGICGGEDNCPGVYNPDQLDSDGDQVGDICDPCPSDPLNDDPDGDGICGIADNCPGAYNPDQLDIDGDQLGDSCDFCPSDPLNDVDGDGVCGDVDNCPGLYNSSQLDTDLDGFGNACDGDDDDDGLLDAVETNTGVFVSPSDTGTNPLIADSDWDGFDDGLEVAAGSDPTSSSSVPPLCGDVNVDDFVDAGDVTLFRDVLAGVAALTPEGQARCTTIDPPGDCDLLDLTVMRRDIEGPLLGPGIQQVCEAMNRRSIALDGSGQRLDIEDADDWTFAGDFTIELWTKFTSAAGFRAFIGHDEGPHITNKWIFGLNISAAPRVEFHIVGPATPSVFPISFAFTPSTGVWYHWAVTRTGTQWRLYRDGQLVDGPHVDATTLPNAAASLTIGNAEAAWHSGLIDEVRIWGMARSETEIQAFMVQELSGDEPNLLGYWRLDNSLLDSTPGGRDGAAVGGPAFSGDVPF